MGKIYELLGDCDFGLDDDEFEDMDTEYELLQI